MPVTAPKLEIQKGNANLLKIIVLDHAWTFKTHDLSATIEREDPQLITASLDVSHASDLQEVQPLRFPSLLEGVSY